jgi:hypothetical protein
MVLLNLFHNLFKLTVSVTVFITSAFAGVIPLFNPSSMPKYENRFSLNVSTYLTNDPFTLKDLLLNGIKGEEHTRNGDNIALTVGRADVGYGDKKYGYIGYTYREEIFIEASKDMVDLLYEATNKEDLRLGRYYDLYLLLKAYKMQGLTYSNYLDLYKKNGWDINIGVAVEGLYATDMQDGYISGNAVANTKKDYSFYGVSNYNYTHNYLYDLSVNPSDAYGYSTHFSLSIEKEKYHFLFIANDIFSNLYWNALPYSDVYLSSSNKEYDSDGYVKYRPLLSGKEGYIKYTQSLMQKYRAEIAYKYRKDLIFNIGSDYMERVYMPYLDCTYIWNQNASVKIGYETRFKSVSIASRYKGFSFGINANDLFKPSSLGISIGMDF